MVFPLMVCAIAAATGTMRAWKVDMIAETPSFPLH
jgi:hypothetical protein